MIRVLLRIGVLAAVVIIGGTAVAAATSPDTANRLAAKQMTSDPSICLFIDGVWYCFEDFDSAQGSSRPASANS